MVRRSSTLIRALWVLLLGGVAHAAERDTVFRQLSLEQGLTQSTVTSLWQDRRGFIWVGTQAGLHRFDGHHMVQIDTDGDPYAPSEALISALVEGADGALWVGTATSGVARFDPTRRRFDPVPPSAHRDLGRARQITALLYQPGRGLWIASHAGIEWLPNAGEQRKVVYAIDADAPPPHSVTALARTAGDEVYAATEAGLLALSAGSPVAPVESTQGLAIRALVARPEGGLWLMTADGVYA